MAMAAAEARPKRKDTSLAALVQRLAQRTTMLEEQADRTKLMEEVLTDAALRTSVPALVEATSAAQDRLLKVQQAQSAALDAKFAEFAQRVRETMDDFRAQHQDAAAAVEIHRTMDQRSLSEAVSNLEERIGRAEARISTLIQEHALYVARGGSATTSSAVDGAQAARAAAESSASSLKQALAAAESAEIAASTSCRELEEASRRQQRALEEGRERERRLTARCDELAQALSSQAAATTRVIEAEAQARAQAVSTMAQRFVALERALQSRDAEMREMRRELHAIAIERVDRPDPSQLQTASHGSSMGSSVLGNTNREQSLDERSRD